MSGEYEQQGTLQAFPWLSPLRLIESPSRAHQKTAAGKTYPLKWCGGFGISRTNCRIEQARLDSVIYQIFAELYPDRHDGSGLRIDPGAC